MNLKKLCCLVLSVCICLCVSGCGMLSGKDELLAPPQLTGEMRPIGEALSKSVGENIDLKYPTSGDYHSAIILKDISADGIYEALAFYTTSDDEMTLMHINLICQRGDEWVSVADHTIVATGVERVDFCDIDGDSQVEIIVGWQVNGNTDKQLSVFDYQKDALAQILLQPYTGFVCCDLDSNGTNELFVHLINTVENTNKGIIFSYADGSMLQSHSCMMDSGVKTATWPKLSELSNGHPAIYIDEIKGVGAVTEILFMSKDQLVNPLLDTQTSFENFATIRAASIEAKDINGDGIIEVPVASDLPNADGIEEKLYYTNWCSFNGEQLAVKLVTVFNTVDGFYLTVPNSMVGKIAVRKNIENHKRAFYTYDESTDTLGELLFTICAVPIHEFEKDGYNANGASEITRTESTVFTIVLTEHSENFGINFEYVKEAFKVIE